MCGIFGATGRRSAGPPDDCARLLAHRGPDGFGLYHDTDAEVYLAHTRLAIIDLSADGRQPMCNEDGTIWLTYNGEIYNFLELRDTLVQRGHVFASHTDSEVILHAYEEWGDDCFERFNGMFAFGLWDARHRRLVLVRDRLGIKPLYYTHDDDGIAFASEPKALIALPGFTKTIDPCALLSFLVHRYVAGRESIWAGVSRLLPGEYLVYDLATKRPELHRYWRLDVEQRSWTESKALDELESLLHDSVHGQLMSDVPLGVFLSGGLDSTCVASFAAREIAGCSTFTMGFEGWDRSEVEVARETAALLHTRHHEDVLHAQRLAGLDEVFGVYDEPLADVSIFPTYLLCGLARREATVALSGDGGDELFGGYEWYTQTADVRPLKSVAFALAPLWRGLGLARTELGRRSDRAEHYRRMTFPGFTIAEICRLFPDLARHRSELPEMETYLYEKHRRPRAGRYKQWQYSDAATFLPDDNLTKVDRASMAHSLEVRVPLLDHRIVEFAFSLPDALCIREGEKKYLLRRLLERRGAGHVLDRPKQGFGYPHFQYWSPASMVAELLEGDLVRDGVVAERALAEMLNASDASNYNAKLWLLIVLERWYRTWLKGSPLCARVGPPSANAADTARSSDMT